MKQRFGFVSNSSSSSFVIIGKGKNEKEIIERFKSEMQEWTEKVATKFEECGLPEYDNKGNIKDILITISSESDDKFEKALTEIDNFKLRTLRMGRRYDEDDY